jgi:biopolymer transport protein ExbB
LIQKKDMDAAITACTENDSPTARVIAHGLRYIHLGRQEVREAMNDIGQMEVQNLAKWSSVIGVSATISPLLGLLGTVLGMIKVFVDLSQYENPAIGVLARGIYEALITTAAGLPVGIMAFLFYTYVQSRIDRIATAMETAAMPVLEAASADRKTDK